ncbi:hypothetical protein ES703_43734 [subsurface metagenome]
MSNFTDLMVKIISLSGETLDHVQAEKFDAAQDKLLKISHTSRKAMKQIANMLLKKSQGTDPKKRIQP